MGRGRGPHGVRGMVVILVMSNLCCLVGPSYWKKKEDMEYGICVCACDISWGI